MVVNVDLFLRNGMRSIHGLNILSRKTLYFALHVVFFSLPATSKADNRFLKVGYSDWKHATAKNGALEKNNSCHQHRLAMVAWSDFTKNQKEGTSISNRLDKSRASQIEKNRHYIATVAEVVLLCARQNIPFRGHDESSISQNRGSFLEVFHVISKHDKIIEERLKTNKSASYTSPGVQNLMINILGDLVRKNICEEVVKAGAFSILVDETKDCAKTEQMSVVLRYAVEKAVIQERFLTFVEASSQNAESFSMYIFDTLKKYHLDAQMIVSQGYDGASVMSGRCSGVQQRIKAIVPQAVYIHCYAHTLNLVLVDTVKSVKEAAEFFALLEALYVFLSTAKANTIFTEQQAKLHPNKPNMKVQRLSETRWACRYASVNCICCRFDCVLATLEELAEVLDAVKAVEAKGLYHQVKSFPFLINLILFDKILGLTKGLSDELQNDRVDLASAAELVVACQVQIQHYRSDEMWNKLLPYVHSVAELYDIEIEEVRARPSRRKKAPRNSDDFVVYESTGSRDVRTCSDHFKQTLYYLVLDAFLNEMSRRFDEKNIEIMKAIQACHPHSSNFLHTSDLKPLIDNYHLDEDSIAVEVSMATHMLSAKELSHTSEVLVFLTSLPRAFPNIIRLFRIALTISVSTAECERSFSALKRIKSYLRSTMGEQRLTDLAVLVVERELSSHISNGAILEEFKNRDNNRIILLF